jgi:hypothetical protein
MNSTKGKTKNSNFCRKYIYFSLKKQSHEINLILIYKKVSENMSSIKYENGKTLKTRTDSIELQSSLKHRSENVPQGIQNTKECHPRRFLICAGSVRNNNVICFFNGIEDTKFLHIWPSKQLYRLRRMMFIIFYVYALELHENALS